MEEYGKTSHFFREIVCRLSLCGTIRRSNVERSHIEHNFCFLLIKFPKKRSWRLCTADADGLEPKVQVVSSHVRVRYCEDTIALVKHSYARDGATLQGNSRNKTPSAVGGAATLRVRSPRLMMISRQASRGQGGSNACDLHAAEPADRWKVSEGAGAETSCTASGRV